MLGTRNDGIVVVQLRTSLGKPYLGYFHLSQASKTHARTHARGQAGQCHLSCMIHVYIHNFVKSKL